jgi:hypothetical protein
MARLVIGFVLARTANHSIGFCAEPGAGDGRRERQQCEPDHVQLDQAHARLQAKRGEQHGPVKSLEHAAPLVLAPAAHARPQGRKRAGQTGEAAEDSTGESNDRVRRPAAEGEGHRFALEIKCGRKHQQQHADAQLEDVRIGVGDQHGAERHAGKAADQKWPDQRQVEAAPHPRHGRGLGNHRTDQDQRHRQRGRQHVEPDPQRRHRRAEPDQAGYEAAGERAEQHEHEGCRGQFFLLRHSGAMRKHRTMMRIAHLRISRFRVCAKKRIPE